MAKVFYIPNGRANMIAMFPALDWDNITEFYIELVDYSNNVMATTPINRVQEACDDGIRLHFVNYLGGVDSCTFKRVSVDNDSKSDGMQSPVTIPLDRSKHSINRTNIKANEFFRVEAELDESEMEWIMELFNSPFVWMEWSGEEGEDPGYIAVVLADAKVQKYKREERFSYTVIVDFFLSHDKVIIRG